jgi:ribosomal protein S18 acetylase RimI-like enzyme
MVLIRRAETEDAAGIAHVQVASWRTTYAGIVPEPFLATMNEREGTARWKLLVNDGNDVFVAEREGRIVGFAIGGASRDRVEGCDAELYAIYLLEAVQRTRIGTDLLHELARALSGRGFASMDVWVLAENPAKGFYARTGAHYAAAKEIEIGGARLEEHAYVWPDLRAMAGIA